MPNCTITNLTEQPINIQDLYLDLSPNQVLSVYRSASALMSSRTIQREIAAGRVTLVIAYTPDEVGSDFTPYPGWAGSTYSSGTELSGFDTSALAVGKFGYVAGNRLLAPTDAGSYPSSVAFGAYAGSAGKVLVGGAAFQALFSTASPAPLAGDRVFLARGDIELGMGAVGKVTTAAPATGYVAEVGIVTDVNNATFPINRRAEIMIRVHAITKRAS